MIVWQNAAALWALPLAAVPFIVHLLRTHHAKRVAFPSLRFVQPSRTAAVRMRLPSDVPLMLVRIAIVALAVGALAGPIVLTEARTAAWNARTARAVVVDVSDSMRVADGSAVPPEGAAAEAAAAELRTATYARRIDTRDMEDGLARASRWLAASPPARREVVVISDLQRGTLRRLGHDGGHRGDRLRFIPIGRVAKTKTFDGARAFRRERRSGPRSGDRGDCRYDRSGLRGTPRTQDGRAEADRSGGNGAGRRTPAASGRDRRRAGRGLRSSPLRSSSPALRLQPPLRPRPLGPGGCCAPSCACARIRRRPHRPHGHGAPGASRRRPRSLDDRRTEPRWFTACASCGVGERTASRCRCLAREPLCGGGCPGRADRAR